MNKKLSMEYQVKAVNKSQVDGGVVNGGTLKPKSLQTFSPKPLSGCCLGHTLFPFYPWFVCCPGGSEPDHAWKWCVVSVTDNWAKVEAKMFRIEFGYR